MLADNYRRRAHTGIYFDELSFEEALEKAKKSNKLLFVDCYTSWCGPCKILGQGCLPIAKWVIISTNISFR